MEFASKNLTVGQLNALVKEIGGEEKVLGILRGELLLTISSNTIAAENPDLLSVDYSQTFEQMIADGHYDWKNDDITAKRFPLSGKGIEEMEFKEFHFDLDIESDDAKTRIEQEDRTNPWMPAKIEYLLAFGKKFPDKQRQYPIVALGSVCKVRSNRGVAYLVGHDVNRDLDLRRWDDRWGRICRFLAVRKKVSASQP